jgi:hypothetical protein
MVKSHSRQASEATRPPIVGPTDEELLGRLMENEWRDDLLDDLGDRDEVMKRLFDLALDSLRRTNATASRMVDESVASRRDFDAWLAGMETSQHETRAMIEGLVNGR